MISEEQFQNELDLIIANAVREDVGDGDHSSLSCIPASAQGRAKLLVKDEGIIAGVAFVFHRVAVRNIGAVNTRAVVAGTHAALVVHRQTAPYTGTV